MKLIIPQRIDAASPVPGTGLTDNHFLDFNIMSDYYTMSSFELPASWPEAAKDEFVQIVNILSEAWGTTDSAESVALPSGYEHLAALAVDPDLSLNGTVWDDKEDDPTVSPEDRCVGYHDTDTFDFPNMRLIVQAIADKYAIPREKSCTISVAWSCSDPEIGAFGGESVEIYARPAEKNEHS